MNEKKLKSTHLPMTETAYYILLSLTKERHGYGIMQHVEELIGQRIKLGAGTIYGTLSKLEKDGLIIPVTEEDRRKTYKASRLGVVLLKLEIKRLRELTEHGKKEMGGLFDVHTKIDPKQDTGVAARLLPLLFLDLRGVGL